MELLILAGLAASGFAAVKYHITTVAAAKAASAKVLADVKAEVLNLELNITAHVTAAEKSSLNLSAHDIMGELQAYLIKIKAKL